MANYLKKMRTALLACLLLFAANLSAQTVKGNITDQAGEPIIGATVMEDGVQGNGAVTDLDGNYTITLKGSKKTLKISYVGMKSQTIPVGNRTTVNVKMEDESNALNEVVVVGYGTMKKSDLTGSIGSVNSDDLVAKGGSNVLESMQGAVAGVNITQSTGRSDNSMNIEIRGKSTILGGTSPLFVVDGVICDNIDFLNEQDIEKIDILKDASSAAIYGSRASAGVVMVTTKGGLGVKKGTKPSISYDGYYGVAVVSRMPDFQDAQQFYNYRFLKFLTYAGGIAKPVDGFPTYLMSGASFNQGMLLTDNSNNFSSSVLKTRLANGMNYDWPGEITQNGTQQNHYISINGSSEKISYNVGLGYHGLEGVYKGDKDDKISFKGSLDADITSWLSAGFNLNGARIKHKYTSDDGVKEGYRMNPFMQPYDEDGNIIEQPGLNTTLGTNGNQFTSSRNPLLYFLNEAKQRETWRLLGNVYLDFKFMKGLDLKTTFSPSYTYYDQGQYIGTLTGNTDNTATYNTSRSFSWTWDNVLTYDKTFNKKHHLNVMALFSLEGATAHTSSTTGTNVLDGTMWWNLGTAKGQLNSDGTYNAATALTASTGYGMNRRVSYALRANYTYLDRYMITASVRRDGSSKLAPGHRWVAYPSFALAWRASEENFIKENASWISNLKLRLSYGVTGNDGGLGNFAYMLTVKGPNYYPFGSTYGVNGMYPSGIVDEGLTWEKSHEFNVGLDFGFLNSRINGSVDWYHKKSEDLLANVVLPYEVGAITMATNIGSVVNEGVEASLSGVIIQTKNWNWTVSANYSHNSNHIKDIDGTGNNMLSGSETGNYFINGPINNVYGYVWKGIITDGNMTVPNNQAARDNGFTPGSTVKQAEYYHKVYGWNEGSPIVEDVNGDGQINGSDKHVYRKDPAWTGSINTSLSYTNANWGTIDFNASVYTKQHFNVYSDFYERYYTDLGDRGRMRLQGDYYIPAGTLIDCDGVRADGTYINPKYQQTTHYGDMPFPNNGGTNGGTNNSYFSGAGGAGNFEDVSFWKIKNITLGYTFPKMWTQKWGCQRLRLYVTVTNPFVITGYKGFDPEWASASLKNDGPSTTTWQFGANIKF